MNNKAFLTLLALTGAALLPAAEIAIDSADSWKLNRVAERKQTLKVIDYSPEIGKVLEITMTPSAFPYIELSGKTPVIATSAAELKGTFTIDLFAKPIDPVQSIAVRLQDATGEIFQFRSATPLRSGNWSTITIKPESPVSVWGGNDDKKIDFPVKFHAITIDANKGFDDTVQLMIDNVMWNPPESK